MKTELEANSAALPIAPAHEAGVLMGTAKGSVRGQRVWIDIDNSPHVPFFLPIIEELRALGIEVSLTARDMYQVRELLEFFDLPCRVIGGHYGKNKALKVLANCSRAVQLIPVAAKLRPDLALSHGSRAQILVCKALGIQTLMMHDYEHSTKTGFLKPDWTLTPDVIPDRAMTPGQNRTLKYPGLKEDIYAHRLRPDPSILTDLGIGKDDLVVTLRPPATEAHYHNPESEELFAATLRMLRGKPHVRVVTLPRNARQKKQLQEEWADLISTGLMVIPDAALDGLNLVWFSDLVVSGGGTMNREAAALGVPVYSIFRGKIGAVDQWLTDNGRLTLIEKVEDVETKIILTRWNRPAVPTSISRPALRSVIDSLVSILEGTCLTHHSGQ
jgi:predicted glycosyltransferase